MVGGCVQCECGCSTYVWCVAVLCGTRISGPSQDDPELVRALADKNARKEERAIFRAERRMEELVKIARLHTPPTVGKAIIQIVWCGG